jgi:hypothetical protein
MFKASGTVTGATSACHQIQVNEISSAIQKAVRRGDEKTAVWFTLEWLLFLEWDHQQGKAAITNMRNRIFHVIPFEDVIAFAERKLILDGCEKMDEWEKRGRKLEEASFVITFVKKLCKARRCRLPSDIRSQFVFVNPYAGSLSARLLLENLKKQFMEATRNNMYPKITDLNKVMQLLMALMIHHKEMLEFMNFMIANTDYGVYHGDFLKLTLKLYKLHHTKDDKILWPIHMVLACHLIESSHHLDNETISPDEWKKMLDEHRVSPKMEIPDYAMDMHTRKGRMKGKNGADFAKEGCKVIGEDTEFLVPEWRENYMKRKLGIEIAVVPEIKLGEQEPEPEFPPTITENMLNGWRKRIIVGQKVTANWKQVTLMFGDGVFKGPYDVKKNSVAERIRLTKTRYELAQKVGVLTPKMEFVSEVENPNNVWIKMAQVSKVSILKWKLSKKMDFVNGWSGKVVDKRSMGLESGWKITEEEYRQHPECLHEAILSIIFRFILDPPCGDIHLGNVIVDVGAPENPGTWRAYMIDFEETNGSVLKRNDEDYKNVTWDKLIFQKNITRDVKNLYESILFRGEFRYKLANFLDKCIENCLGNKVFSKKRIRDIQDKFFPIKVSLVKLENVWKIISELDDSELKSEFIEFCDKYTRVDLRNKISELLD